MSTSGAAPESCEAGMIHSTFLPCLAAAVLIAGCAAGPDFAPPVPPPDRHYLPVGTPGPTETVFGVGQRLVSGAPVAPAWWTLFRSPQLDAAMRAAMQRNPGLQAARASLNASRENLAAGYGVFFPQADVGLSALRQRVSATHTGVLPGPFNVFTLGVTVSYLLDVAGGARRNVEALGAEADNQRYQLAATWLTLSGNIFNTYVARAGYTAQIDATRTLLARLAEQRDIARAQVAGGTVSYANLLAIDSRMASAEAGLPVLEQRRQQAIHLLSSLLGSLPARRQPPALSLDTLVLPDRLPLSLPSALVRQRPDILAAEARLHAASANVGVATAALFPSFRLDAGFGNDGAALGDTTSARGRFWSFGADAVQPLFRGGTLTHQRRAAIADYQRALADYRTAVLAAFTQVADTLTALGNDARTLQAQAHAVDAARRALALLQANYQAGLVGYLDVLVADEQLQRAQIDTIQALAQRFQDTAALYLALGGGWPGVEDALGTPTRSTAR
jgi:NodT family efflux transporter outer membrane factor (OMF) lipoprotein